MKAWQGVTHPPTSPTWMRAGIKHSKTSGYGFLCPTREVRRAWELMADAAKALNVQVVVQTPPNMPADSQLIMNGERFFRDVATSGFAVGWELRGELARNWEAGSIIYILTGVMLGV
jgi:uncharacterized protein YecE (DUF72 family)